jgi:pheromone shutdown-related protein TraB
MEKNETSEMVQHLTYENKEITIIGTAHVSKESAELVSRVIEDEKPDTVCIELCESRYQSIKQKDRWRNMDIVKVIKEKKTFLLLSNLLLASFQKKIADNMEIKPGEEMLRAIDSAEKIEANIHLSDREIQTTLSRIWRIMGFWDKIKLLFQLVLSMGDADEISEEDIEKMKKEDALQSLLAEVGKSHPTLRDILIDERDQYLSHKIKSAPGEKIVAVVGAGHLPGIKEYWDTDIDIEPLDELPPKGKTSGLFKWILPLLIMGMFAAGFFFGDTKSGTDMLKWWIAANGILAGIGAIIAFGHPLTILASVLAAPLTSLNPMIAAGWVSGLVEAFSRKPKVKDFESLPDDILSVKGFWKNKVTRILLVVVFTNIGSSVGTMVAIPLMLKVFGS